MLSESRRPAELAAIAARAAGRRARTTEFEIVHRTTDSEDALPLSMTEVALSDEKPHSHQKAQETLGFDIPGASFEIRTWSSITELPDHAGVAIKLAHNRPGDGSGEQVPVVTGIGVLNPSYLYATSHSVELLVTLRHGRWQMDLRDSLMVTKALEMMSGAAAEHGLAPILFLQSPVAPFRNARHKFRYDGSGEQPRRSRGLAIRMAVAIDGGRPELRVALLRHVTSKAAEMGFGVQIGDDRLGRTRGDWWEILAADETTYQRHKSTHFGLIPTTPVERVQLLTFVGPARTGSTLAIVRGLQARRIGVVAIAVSALQELAFINLVVAVPEPKSDSVAAEPSGLTNGLRYLAGVAGLTRGSQVAAQTGGDLEAARDYHVILTGPVVFRSSDGLHRPLWVSWEIPDGLDDIQKAIPELVREALIKSPHRTHVSLDYFRSRIFPSGQIRGRAKIAVTLAKGLDGKLADILGELCEHAETDGKRILSLSSAKPDIAAKVRLRVVWREKWLDRGELVL